MLISEALKVLEKFWDAGEYHKVRKGAIEILEKHSRNKEALVWLEKAEKEIGLPEHEHHHKKHKHHLKKKNFRILMSLIGILVVGAVAVGLILFMK